MNVLTVLYDRNGQSRDVWSHRQWLSVSIKVSGAPCRPARTSSGSCYWSRSHARIWQILTVPTLPASTRLFLLSMIFAPIHSSELLSRPAVLVESCWFFLICCCHFRWHTFWDNCVTDICCRNHWYRCSGSLQQCFVELINYTELFLASVWANLSQLCKSSTSNRFKWSYVFADKLNAFHGDVTLYRTRDRQKKSLISVFQFVEAVLWPGVHEARSASESQNWSSVSGLSSSGKWNSRSRPGASADSATLCDPAAGSSTVLPPPGVSVTVWVAQQHHCVGWCRSSSVPGGLGTTTALGRDGPPRCWWPGLLPALSLSCRRWRLFCCSRRSRSLASSSRLGEMGRANWPCPLHSIWWWPR